MIILTIYILLITTIIIRLLFIPILLSKSIKKSREKNITVECGINIYSLPRKPLTIRFFLLMVLFIVFDIEIALVLIIPITKFWSPSINLFFNRFFIILLIGILYEWNEGSLNWKL